MDSGSTRQPKGKIGINYCDDCALPVLTCLCGIIPKIHSDYQFWLITHDNEHTKPTNTGQLIRALVPDTQILNWSRIAPDPYLLALLRDERFAPCLVFPSIYAVPDHSHYEQFTSQHSGSRQPAFIIIDATWQQARKIYRKSPYLHHLPLLSLLPENPSIYTLRRNQHRQHLCTAEVAAEILYTHGEVRQATVLMALLQVFCDRYESARMGQQPDNFFDARRVRQGLVSS